MNLKDILGDSFKEGMTLEEIETALAGKSMPEDKTAEIEKLKQAISKSNSEAAAYKKQLNEKLSDEERKKQEDEDKWNDLQKKYDALLKEKTLAEHKARFTGLGLDDTASKKAAEALANGDMDKMFALIGEAQKAASSKAVSDYMHQTPPPEGGGVAKTMTKDKFLTLSDEDRFKFSVEHPDEYAALYKE